MKSARRVGWAREDTDRTVRAIRRLTAALGRAEDCHALLLSTTRELIELRLSRVETRVATLKRLQGGNRG